MENSTYPIEFFSAHLSIFLVPKFISFSKLLSKLECHIPIIGWALPLDLAKTILCFLSIVALKSWSTRLSGKNGVSAGTLTSQSIFFLEFIQCKLACSPPRGPIRLENKSLTIEALYLLNKALSSLVLIIILLVA